MIVSAGSRACSLTVHLGARSLFEGNSNCIRLKFPQSEHSASRFPTNFQFHITRMISSESSTRQQSSLANGKFNPIQGGGGGGGGGKDGSSPVEHHNQSNSTKQTNGLKTRRPDHDYSRAIQDLNLLQSNTQVLALAKYKTPETIIPLFRRQLELAGLQVDDLNRLNIIHVSGTKGKGSTCAFTESILRHAGLKTGFYNSPHLIKVTERIKINGQPIGETLFARYFRDIFDRLVDGTRREELSMPSYFSFLTILAFHIFLEEKVDCSLIEVGIGGEYDPTNVIEQPVACAITTLDLDHTNILGKTIESIAWTKAGIIKSGRPVFTVPHEQAGAMEMILKRASDKGAAVHLCNPIAGLPKDKSLGIDSSVQHTNASLACHLAEYFLQKQCSREIVLGSQSNGSELPGHGATSFDLTNAPSFFLDGLVNCQWPGRCQVMEYPRVVFFIDGAHTRKSMENCLEWFVEKSTNSDATAQRVLMINVIGERDRAEVLKPLTKYKGFDAVIFSTNRVNTAGDTPKSETFVNMQGPNCEKSLENIKLNASTWLELQRGPTGEAAASESGVLIKANIVESLMEIDGMVRQAGGCGCHVLATGSLHFVGAVLETLQSSQSMELFGNPEQ